VVDVLNFNLWLLSMFVHAPKIPQLARSTCGMWVLTVAAIVFGILGVWVSVLNPAAALDEEFNEAASDSTRLAMKFAPLLRQATILLAITVILRFGLPLTPDPSNPMLGQSIRGSVGFAVAFLYLWQVGILVGTLLPIERSASALQLAASRRRWRRDAGRQEARSPEKVANGRSHE
jgi:hypothetical protein